MPVMLVYGDSDMFRPEHIVEFHHLLGGGLKDAVSILPDLTHYEIGAAPALAHAVLPFLNGLSGTKSWSQHVQEAR